MRRAAVIFALFACLGAAQVLDRVVAAAGHQVVTLSAVRRQLRIEALFENRPVDESAGALRRAAGRLVDQALIRREIELSRYAPSPMADAEARVEELLRERRQTSTQFLESLTRYGFTEDQFKQEVQWRITVSRFIDFRFAAGIQVSDAEIDKYYRGELLPKLKGSPAPRLDEVRDRIAAILTTAKTNDAVEQWLAQTRAAQKVRYFEEAFR